ncbi:CHAP domain-containing protein [Nonomuraea purpurea]|uniref:CHAP domain-containing protein n=1 Tax=Nonomuraea purpurea TaxID=1849276 RepID=A0ABV8GKW9_9ACTN
MTPEMQKYIDLLESQLGYAEKADAYTKFGAWYGKNVEFDADYSSAPWCDMFLSWAGHKLGYEEWIGQFAWTVEHAKWFKKQGAWGKKPEPGAFVFYDWSGSKSIDKIDHVGIVTRVEGDTIFTIEANIDGGVAKRKERDTSKVVGYGYPERVKARLEKEAAKKEAENQVIEVPDQSLASLIPRTGTQPPGQGSLVLNLDPGAQPQDRLQSQDPASSKSETRQEPKGQTKKPTSKSGSPATSSTAKKVPQSTATSSSGADATAKKGKHAKPTTADTTSATAEPLPTHVDASAGNPLPSLNTPTLIGSTLVAALALLAVVKTRRVRAASAAAKPAPRPARPQPGRRRRRGTPLRTSPLLVTTEPTADLITTGAGELVTTSAADLVTAGTGDLFTTAAGELVTTGPGELVTAGTGDLFTAARELTDITAGELVAATAHLSTPDILSTVRDTLGRLAAAHASPGRTSHLTEAGSGETTWGAFEATSGAFGGVGTGGGRATMAGGPDDVTPARGRRALPFDTRPFDLTTDATPRRIDTGHAAGTDLNGTGHDYGTAPFSSAFDNVPYEPDFDRDRFDFTDQTGPMERIVDTDPAEVVVDTGPMERVVGTGTFERIVIPGATSKFDAFTPTGRTSTPAAGAQTPTGRTGTPSRGTLAGAGGTPSRNNPTRHPSTPAEHSGIAAGRPGSPATGIAAGRRGMGGSARATGAQTRATSISATYQGRRRATEAVDELTTYATALPRGRRHRRATSDPVEEFFQEAPLRGRRHRELVGAGSAPQTGRRGRHRA